MSKSYINAPLRKLVKERANHICEYCLAISKFAFHPFAIDHIIPSSTGGATVVDNLAHICQHCNNAKYNKSEGLDPITKAVVPFYHPRQDIWNEHFIWNGDRTIIIGITPKGRTTVLALKMNREEAVNLRRALFEFGVHPPKV